jgi:hypothetical protein
MKPDRLTLDEAARKMARIMDKHFKSMTKMKLRILLYEAINSKSRAVQRERQRVLAQVVRLVKNAVSEGEAGILRVNILAALARYKKGMP